MLLRGQSIRAQYRMRHPLLSLMASPMGLLDDMCIETNDGIKHCKLNAVHAGLEKGKDAKKQRKYLKSKDTRFSKVEPLSGRKNVRMGDSRGSHQNSNYHRKWPPWEALY